MQQLNLILPFHITTDKILKVIAKIVGSSFTKKSILDINYEFDPDLPSSNNNTWYIKFDENEVYYEHIIPKNYDCIKLLFKDINNNTHIWHALGQGFESIEGKNFNPPYTMLNLAIAKRLVDFFGGYVNLDGPKLNYIYNPAQGISFCNEMSDVIKYNPFAYAKDNNNLWNLFENTLNNEPLLEISELDQAKEFNPISNPIEQSLYNTLQHNKLEKYYNKLDNIIPQKNNKNIQKRKI